MHRIAAVAILFSVAAQAQLTRTSEQISVSVIEVDAVVLDASGKPVAGLKQSDFDLRVGGRRTPITNFYEMNRRDDVSNGSDTVKRRDYVVLFIDDLHLRQSEKKRALDALRKFVVQHVHRGTAAMLVVSRGNVRIRQRFTEEPRQILSAVDSIEREPARVEEYDRERRDVLSYIDDQRRECRDPRSRMCRPETIPPRIEALSDLDRHTAETTIGAVDQVMSAVAGLDGRRVLVYISDGLPMQPGVEVSQYFKPEEFLQGTDSAIMRIVQQSQPLDSMKQDLNLQFHDLAERSAALGVQFFAIDAGGAHTKRDWQAAARHRGSIAASRARSSVARA